MAKKAKAAPRAVTTSRSVPAYVKAKEPSKDQLERVRTLLRKARDLRKEIDDLAERSKDKSEELRTLEQKTLPELFTSTGITNIGLEAEGNMPAYEATKSPYYRANIAASWDEEKRQKAFSWLKANGGADLVKTDIEVSYGAASQKQVKFLVSLLRKYKIPFSLSEAVHSQSLTAFIKEKITKQLKVPLDVLGADVGEIVRMKPRQEK